MTFDARKALNETEERNEHAAGRNPIVAVSASVIAVCAALTTMFSNHYSVKALSEKNQAILQQTRASDAYNYYESKRIKYHIYTAFLAAGIAENKHGSSDLLKTADAEERAALPILKEANGLETETKISERKSEVLLDAHESLVVATTLLEIAIVFVSISALTQTRALIFLGGAFAVGGVVTAAVALLHAR